MTKIYRLNENRKTKLINPFALFSVLWLMLFFSVTGQAQTTVRSGKPENVYIEAGGFVVSGPMPFWLRANQSGIVPLAGSTGTVRIGFSGAYRQVNPTDSLAKPKKVDWGYGLELVGNAGQQSQFLVPEAYLKARWGRFELYAGRRRDQIGLVDTMLTSGSFSWSGNALPIPKVQLGTLGYVPVPFTKGLISFNALYNHGWFENVNKRVIDTRLHQAALYVQLGKPKWPVKLYGGLNHSVVWGGYSSALDNGVSNNGLLPSSLMAYFYAVTARTASSLETDPNVSFFDGTNRIGNHLGTIDIGASIKLPIGKFMLYRQNPYETGALFYLTTLADGLNGLSFRRNQPGKGWFTVDGAVLEWLYTKNQGGSGFIENDPFGRGKVNYFNNEQFIDGWQYYGRVIGTPFLTPQAEVNPNLPVGYPIANTRVSLWHVGLSGRIARQVQWLTKVSYSQNFGTYETPYPAETNQFSALLQMMTPVKLPALGQVQLQTSLALDTGELLNKSSGGYFSIRKTLSY
ncbi:capsule assembly Wzi family protein [Spirosoma luteum]|uniref:capsule assembly Wzi family protein n=1 Tax=Spirosoma luteum TaxID=431553 RepID=UPI000360BD2E|nr:capsule assembly Wzi family protein [Spirosoma luteum]